MFIDRLLATLVHLRHAVTHDVLACWFGVSRSTITRAGGEVRSLLAEPAGRPAASGAPAHPPGSFADQGYSSRGNRRLLRARGIGGTIPQKADQPAHRRRRGSAGGLHQTRHGTKPESPRVAGDGLVTPA
jgi:DDE superfamily endonuclease